MACPTVCQNGPLYHGGTAETSVDELKISQIIDFFHMFAPAHRANRPEVMLRLKRC